MRNERLYIIIFILWYFKLSWHESFLFKGSSYEGDIRMGIVEIMEEETDGEDPEDENEEYRLQVQWFSILVPHVFANTSNFSKF